MCATKKICSLEGKNICDRFQENDILRKGLEAISTFCEEKFLSKNHVIFLGLLNFFGNISWMLWWYKVPKKGEKNVSFFLDRNVVFKAGKIKSCIPKGCYNLTIKHMAKTLFCTDNTVQVFEGHKVYCRTNVRAWITCKHFAGHVRVYLQTFTKCSKTC